MLRTLKFLSLLKAHQVLFELIKLLIVDLLSFLLLLKFNLFKLLYY
jgi:hypothetical protein